MPGVRLEQVRLHTGHTDLCMLASIARCAEDTGELAAVVVSAAALVVEGAATVTGSVGAGGVVTSMMDDGVTGSTTH